MVIPIEISPHGLDLPLPRYATSKSAGMDLLAAIPAEEPVVLKPGERGLVPSGIKIALPDGYEAQIRPRSGLAFRFGVTVLNAPGTIDADYRGEVKVLLINLGEEPIIIHRGDRIAQMVIAPYIVVSWQPTSQLNETPRGEGGFGHTGI
ncbi:MAG TPA: dUTP diphosphatase [Rhodothermales bacterium]|nr:dUTP diphosphatase [Bacteroidota bacterium]HRK72778.1 dUTP diphosphatase [Rhodothermales bacterium]HRR08545.1 dUTP diphosphatase [Rhodothermales bacterium]